MLAWTKGGRTHTFLPFEVRHSVVQALFPLLCTLLPRPDPWFAHCTLGLCEEETGGKGWKRQ